MPATQSPASRRRSKLDFSETIDMFVGESETKFTVHRGVIVNSSTFVRGALSNEFREAQQKELSLPEIEVDLFTIYLQWIYSGEIVLPSLEQSTPDEQGTVRGSLLSRLYVAGDFLDDFKLRNAVVDDYAALMKECNFGPGPYEIDLLWKATPDDNKLRQLILDWYAAFCNTTWLQQNGRTLSTEFLADLALVLVAERGSCTSRRERYFKNVLDCKYHEHNADMPSCATPSASTAKARAVASHQDLESGGRS